MFTLPELPYDHKALEPHIDEQTMQLHHGKHHATYVTNLNTALEKVPEFYQYSIEDLLRNLDKIPDDIRTVVRNNGGGHYNHSFFWKLMSPNPTHQPSGKLKQDIDHEFGNVENFCNEFNKAGLGRFGSGWVWAVVKDKKPFIISTPNQDSPLMEGITPFLGCDVWEHAYYLNYQNRRADYLTAWWNVVDWSTVSRQYEQCL